MTNDQRTAGEARDDVEVVRIDPAELMPAEVALRNYDTAEAAVEAFRYQRGLGYDAPDAMRGVLERHEPVEHDLVRSAITRFHTAVEAGADPDQARDESVIDAADEATPRISAEEVERIRAAFATPADAVSPSREVEDEVAAVGDADVDDAGDDRDPTIARVGVFAVVAELTPPGVLYSADGLWQDVAAEAWANQAAAAGHTIQEYQWHDLGDGVVARVKIDDQWWDLTHDRTNPGQVYAVGGEDHAAEPRPPDTDTLPGRTDELPADTAPGSSVPERAPEPDSWIERNLPVRHRDPASAKAPAHDADEFRVSRDHAARVAAEDKAQLQAERERSQREAAAAHVLDEVADSADSAPLGDAVAECGRTVTDAEQAAHRADVMREDQDRAERCARWAADDAAADGAVSEIGEGRGWV